jgi:hypothetical protein
VDIDYSKEQILVEGNPPLADLDRVISLPLDQKPNRNFLIAISITSTMLLIGVICV